MRQSGVSNSDPEHNSRESLWPKELTSMQHALGTAIDTRVQLKQTQERTVVPCIISTVMENKSLANVSDKRMQGAKPNSEEKIYRIIVRCA